MENEDLVCKRLREILWIPDHVPNEVVLNVTENSIIRARIELAVACSKLMIELKMAFREILKQTVIFFEDMPTK